MTLYVNLAELLGTRIEQGFYRPGDRLPSVRALSVEHGVSLSTVQQAYRLLEDNGLATPKPKSGYFVPWSRELPALPEMGQAGPAPGGDFPVGPGAGTDPLGAAQRRHTDGPRHA
jgi:DNA-binding transcriptional MocR family regulator